MSWPFDVVGQFYLVCFVCHEFDLNPFIKSWMPWPFDAVGQLYLVCFVCLEFDLNPFIKSYYVTHHHLSYEKISFAFSSRFDL